MSLGTESLGLTSFATCEGENLPGGDISIFIPCGLTVPFTIGVITVDKAAWEIDIAAALVVTHNLPSMRFASTGWAPVACETTTWSTVACPIS